MLSGTGEKKKRSNTCPQEVVAQGSSHTDFNLRRIVWVVEQASNYEFDIY